MPNPSDFPGNDGPFVDIDDLRDAGNPNISDDVDLPVIEATPYVLDDADSSECRYATEDEIRPMYIDNPVAVAPVQHDVWTLDIADDEDVTFTYRNGRTYTVRFGDIDTYGGSDAARYYKAGDLVYPTDDGQNVLLNANTTPRLSGFKQYLLDELARRSEERLEMAELVSAFSTIISQYSGALSD